MNATSRYRFSTVERDPSGAVYLGPRPVFGYRDLPDNNIHVVTEGDSLFAIAADAYKGLDRPEQFYWVIADFQPEPIRDVTIPLESERQLYIPSLRTLESQILSANRTTTDEGDV